MTDTPDPVAGEPQARPSSVPFAAALAVVGLVAVLAFAFLRSDDEGRLVRPDRLDQVGDDGVRAILSELPVCERLARAQVDLTDDRVFVELVAIEDETCEGEGVREVVVEISLPEPVDDRELVPGVGRVRLPCTGAGAGPRCGPPQ